MPKKFDLEDRTFEFARNIRVFVNKIDYSIANNEDIKQLVRSSGSVGANYIEANSSLGKKDFLMRIKISRKESKESTYWLKLINVGNNESLEIEKEKLIQESKELMYIFGAIISKSM